MKIFPLIASLKEYYYQFFSTIALHLATVTPKELQQRKYLLDLTSLHIIIEFLCRRRMLIRIETFLLAKDWLAKTGESFFFFKKK